MVPSDNATSREQPVHKTTPVAVTPVTRDSEMSSPADHSSRQYINRKATPIKRADGEAFTRRDIQYDLLNFVFTDETKAFTDPYPDPGVGAPPKLTFGQLYINTLLKSWKISKSLKDKMLESPLFSVDFAKLALLANVGRINSTQAFFPEMRTALRTYHPIPSLQHTEGNLQDAPRIKACLKGCTTQSEAENAAPSTCEEILEKIRNGLRPSTTAINAVFVLSNHSMEVAARHFPDALRMDFLDIFMPCHIPSATRARTFLWLVYYYLEGTRDNPFDDQYSLTHPGKSPYMYRVEPSAMFDENKDTLAEITWGQKMAAKRATFVEKQMEADKEVPPTFRAEVRPPPPLPVAKEVEDRKRVAAPPKRSKQVVASEKYDGPEPEVHYHDNLIRGISHQVGVFPPNHLEPGGLSMFHYAWRSGQIRDPLADSDGEDADETVRKDYEKRLFVLSRLIGDSTGSSNPHVQHK